MMSVTIEEKARNKMQSFDKDLLADSPTLKPDFTVYAMGFYAIIGELLAEVERLKSEKEGLEIRNRRLREKNNELRKNRPVQMGARVRYKDGQYTVTSGENFNVNLSREDGTRAWIGVSWFDCEVLD